VWDGLVVWWPQWCALRSFMTAQSSVASSPVLPSPSEKPRLASGLRCGGGGHGARATGLPLCRRALCRGTGAGSKP
jgi:hypothetical protein